MASELQPNVAVTATLNQSRSYDGPRGLSWKRGDPILYEGVLAGLITRLSKSAYGRSAVAKHGKRIAAGGAIEGDGFGQAYHAHLLIRRPDHLSVVEFDEMLRSEFLRSPWLKPDLDVQQITGNWVGYVHKGNPETFMVL